MFPYDQLIQVLDSFGILSKGYDTERPYFDPKVLTQKQDYDDHRWYKIDPQRNFLDSGAKDVRAQDGGACDGNWFDPKFL